MSGSGQKINMSFRLISKKYVPAELQKPCLFSEEGSSPGQRNFLVNLLPLIHHLQVKTAGARIRTKWIPQMLIDLEKSVCDFSND